MPVPHPVSPSPPPHRDAAASGALFGRSPSDRHGVQSPRTPNANASRPGCSPPTGAGWDDARSAKSFLNRLKWDAEIEAGDYVVGYRDDGGDPSSGPGATATLGRQRSSPRVVEEPFPAFSSRPEASAAYHRVLYITRHGAIVWAAATAPDASRRVGSSPGVPPRLGGTPPPPVSLLGASPPPGVWAAVCSSLGSSPQDETASPQPPSSPPGGGLRVTLLVGPDGMTITVAVMAVVVETTTRDTSPALPPLPADVEVWLPDAAWALVLSYCGTREVCALAQLSRQLRRVASIPTLWGDIHRRLFGRPFGAPTAGPAGDGEATVPPPSPLMSRRPPPTDNAWSACRRVCRTSELRVTWWVDPPRGAQHPVTLGPSSGACCAVDESQVVSGDGSALRLWSPRDGRKIATLRGHSEAVSCVAFDSAHVVSGDAGGALRLWGLDDLKCARLQARAHGGEATVAVQLMGGLPISAGEDGCVRIWDAGLGAAIATCDAGSPLRAFHGDAPGGRLYTASAHGVAVWDLASAHLLGTLGPPGGAPPGSPLLTTVDAVCARGPLVALARGATVELWDSRCATDAGAAVLVLDLLRGRRAGGAAEAVVTWGGGVDAAVPSSDDDDDAALWGGAGENILFEGDRPEPYFGASPPAAAAAGLLLDDWKLIAADGGGVGAGVVCYDLRSAPSALHDGMHGTSGGWAHPLWRRKAGGPVTCLAACGPLLLAGVAGGAFSKFEFAGGVKCDVWEASARGDDDRDDMGKGSKGTKGRGAGASVHKERGRYAKRTHK